MSPRLTSSTHQRAGRAAARATRRSSTAMPARAEQLEERRLRLDHRGRVARTPRRRCRRSASSPSTSSGSPHGSSSAGVRVDAHAQRAAVRRGRRRGARAERSLARPASVPRPRSHAGRSAAAGGRSRPRRRAERSRARRGPASSSARMRIGAVGSPNTAVPTDTADAPARTNCSASSPVRMPPMPRIGRCGSACVHLPDAAHRDRPDRRPGQAAGDPAERRAQRVGVDHHARAGC